MWVYVSRGTGYWGPPMRFGIPSEITLIRLAQDFQGIEVSLAEGGQNPLGMILDESQFHQRRGVLFWERGQERV